MIGRGGRVLILGLLGVVALFVAHVAVGRGALGIDAVLKTLVGQSPSATAALIVGELRLPRALIAVTAGALLGLSGMVLQSVVRNPLAEPGLLGVTAGAVLAAVCYLAFVPATYVAFGQGVGQDGGLLLPLVTLSGGLAAGTLVWALARVGGTDPLRIVLVGVVLAAVLSAVTSLVLLLHNEAIGGITLWLVGSLNGRTWLHWDLLWPWTLVALTAGLLSAALINALALGDDVAGGLGLPVAWVRAGLLAVGVLPVAAAVAVVGAIGFVGLIGPHIARKLVGEDARILQPAAVLTGAALLLAADILAGALPFTKIDLPVGAVTAFLGAPFFLALLARGARRRTVMS